MTAARPWTVVTPSRVIAFHECPRRYSNENLLSLRGEPESDMRQALGVAVHDALAKIHEAGQCGDRATDAPAAPAGVDPADVVDLLDAHYQLCPSRTGSRLLGTELDLFWWDRDSRTLYRGRADAIWQSDEGLEIRDYKTGKMPQGEMGRRIDVASYAVLAAVAFPKIRPVTVAFEHLAEGAITSHTFDQEGFGEAIGLLQGAGSDLSDATEFPARPGPRCAYCQFKATCPEAAI